jgi:hypothetical protein
MALDFKPLMCTNKLVLPAPSIPAAGDGSIRVKKLPPNSLDHVISLISLST